MGRERTPEVDALATRERIIKTAEMFFRLVGYSKTTVADIARQLNMSSANVYRYFPTKGRINEEICDRFMSSIGVRCICSIGLDGTIRDRIKSFLLMYYRMFMHSVTKDIRMCYMLNIAIQQSYTVIKSHNVRIESIISSLLDHGIAVGEFKDLDRSKMARAIHESIAVFIYPSILDFWLNEFADARQDDTIEGQLMFLLDRVFNGACM